MLIAVNMNDKETFDSLYSTWTSNKVGSTLMQWCLSAAGGGTGSGCSTGSTGSATDADEDAAFALLQAAKIFGDASYKTKALAMISEIWSSDIDSATKLPKGGSNYASPTGTSGTGITNASYFAPAYYTAFKAAGDSNDWDSVNSAVYSAIGKIAGSTGLIPAWCGNSCTAAASNGASTDVDYQYDSHRIPMRLGLDYCFNGTAAAKTYTDLTTSFFATNASAGKNGVGRILDMYTPSGGNVSDSALNSASILGTAAVGAMASGNQSFLNDAYQAVFDAVTRGTMAPVDSSSKTTYSFNNATVGILTLLIMNGNFSH
jgi:endo-1,4-beta-D-glucanase Y